MSIVTRDQRKLRRPSSWKRTKKSKVCSMITRKISSWNYNSKTNIEMTRTRKQIMIRVKSSPQSLKRNRVLLEIQSWIFLLMTSKISFIIWIPVRRHYRDSTTLAEPTIINSWTAVSRIKRNSLETTDYRIKIIKQGETSITSFRGLRITSIKDTEHTLCLHHQMDLIRAQNAVRVWSTRANRSLMSTKTCWMLERANTITTRELVSLSTIHNCNLMS